MTFHDEAVRNVRACEYAPQDADDTTSSGAVAYFQHQYVADMTEWALVLEKALLAIKDNLLGIMPSQATAAELACLNRASAALAAKPEEPK